MVFLTPDVVSPRGGKNELKKGRAGRQGRGSERMRSSAWPAAGPEGKVDAATGPFLGAKAELRKAWDQWQVGRGARAAARQDEA